ncbi:MAG: DUF4245 domain-containing protein [Salinibacterium sp.]|nr:DUF4245 domain-containing protein [Salinibacterium sp.]
MVAELGRPETPEETAARKAASSRRYRESKTSINLLVALFASLALVLVTVMIVVRPAPPPADPVEYSEIASQVQADIGEVVADPALGSDWVANAARVSKGADGVSRWYIGFVTPEKDFAAITQGIDANPTWLAATLEGGFATGTATIAGQDWDIYDRRDGDDIGNFAYAMATVIGTSTIVLHGTASDEEFAELAAAVTASMSSDSTASSDSTTSSGSTTSSDSTEETP